jgi:putative MFS transporter
MRFDGQTGSGGDVPLPEIPTAFLHVGCRFPRAGVVYYFFGIEPREQSIAEIDMELARA